MKKILVAACGLALVCTASAKGAVSLLKTPVGVIVHGNDYSYCHTKRDVRSCVHFATNVNFDTEHGVETLLGPKSELIYRHALDGRAFTEFSVYAQLHKYIKTDPGHVEISISPDARKWTVLGTVTTSPGRIGALDRTIRAGFPLPARQVFVRYRGMPDLKRLTIVFNTFTAKFGGTPLYSREYPHFGGRIEGASLPLWTAPSGWRVMKDQPLPDETAKGVGLRLAANEAESTQLVLRPKADVADVRVAAELKGLPADAVDVRYVRYIRSRIPSDSISMPGWHPDALPPQEDEPIAVKAGENQPFWITVRTPKKTPRGIYRGELTVNVKYASGRTETERVPLAVGVFGFELPDVKSCGTTFGHYPFQLRTYHRPKTPEEERQVKRAFFKAHRDYNISLRELDQPKVTWKGDDPRTAVPVFDFTAFDADMELADEFDFRLIPLSVAGFGNGLNSSVRSDLGKNVEAFAINGVPDTDPAYDRLMKLYYGELERHLREKGWDLSRFWCDAFDEPNNDDYPMVCKIYRSIHKYAPWLTRVLTEQPEPEFLDCVDVLNPILDQFESPHMDAAKKAGIRFKWYICNVPRTPYITDCLDHPALEMRVWVWQSWMKGVSCLSTWATNWWNSRNHYPDYKIAQNPYEDPVSWRWHGPGHWGNGEADLFFPPVKVAYGRAAGTLTGFTPGSGPVPSQRVAMLRDGIDDYEYLAILKKLDPENPLLKVPEEICKSLTEFSIDPQYIESHRLKVAHEIERLSGRP